MARLLLALAVGLLASCAPGLPTPEGDGAPSGTFRIVFFDVGQGERGPPGGADRQACVDRRRTRRADRRPAPPGGGGGAAAVLRAFPVRFFMDNGLPHTTATYRRLLEALRERDVPLLEPERREIRLGDATLEILPPPGDARLGHNDNSVGAVLRFGQFRASFAGDAERRLWSHWLEVLPDALSPVQVHKASHHGSRNGDTEEAIERLRPELVVVSAGRENQFGHPHVEALALYQAVGATVLSTGKHGTTTVRAGPDGSFRVDVERDPVAGDPGCVDLDVTEANT